MSMNTCIVYGSDNMPSQTFLNLDNEKQNKFMKAATDEFSSHEYNDVSINQIIMNAGIARGSFYMYFKDKNDLFEYIIETNKKMFIEEVLSVLKKNKGDLYSSFSDLYDLVVGYISKKNYKIIFKNAFIYFNMHKNTIEKPGDELFSIVKDFIDSSNLRRDDEKIIFDMLLHNLFLGITYGINNDCLADKDIYLRKLHILCYGVYEK